jgi:hypothetical protein
MPHTTRARGGSQATPERAGPCASSTSHLPASRSKQTDAPGDVVHQQRARRAAVVRARDGAEGLLPGLRARRGRSSKPCSGRLTPASPGRMRLAAARHMNSRQAPNVHMYTKLGSLTEGGSARLWCSQLHTPRNKGTHSAHTDKPAQHPRPHTLRVVTQAQSHARPHSAHPHTCTCQHTRSATTHALGEPTRSNNKHCRVRLAGRQRAPAPARRPAPSGRRPPP